MPSQPWRRTGLIAGLVGSIALVGVGVLSGQGARAPRPYSTWRDYGGSADSMQYSSLTQITKTNVQQLEQAWFYPVPDRKGNFGFNPLIVDRTMYVFGPNNAIVALDAVTGQSIWSHVVKDGTPGQRGINYWESRDRSDRRLIFGAGGSLREINAKTGEPILTFGENGRVDMRKGTFRPLGGPTGTAGRVFEHLFITGSTTGEMYGSPPGDIRAFDVITGKLVWTFHTIPHPGEFGYDTWPKDAYKWAGGVNNWGEMSIDEKRGVAYVPLGSPTHDSFGGDRKGANLFGNSLVALDARTGKRLWHFQTVHHDVWDYDLTTGPKLLTVRHDGKKVDIVAQATKFGLLYVFDRVTGKPLWPVEERPVPQTTVPGEQTWPTQPFPTKPEPYARLKFSDAEINPHVSPEEQEKLRARLRAARNEGLFTPQELVREQITIPGELGGSNWGGAAADPTTGWMYVRTADQPGIHKLREPAPPGSAESRGGSPMQRGRAVYRQFCESCHGNATEKGIQSFDKTSFINIQALGPDKVRQQVRNGQGQMPPFPQSTLTDEQLAVLLRYLDDPTSVGGDGGPPPPPPITLAPIEGITRYTGPLGTMMRTENGLPAIAPPWAQIVAYDLNDGAIKWRAPLGTVKVLADKGITDTGNATRVHRNGMVVTAGGLIFIGTNADGIVRAFDKDTGKILWERQLDANPEGVAAVYEVDGREYVAFCTSYYVEVGDRNEAVVQGRKEAQGYYVFALPEKPKATTSSH